MLQIGFSTVRLILPTSKYSRYICVWRNKGSSFHFLCSHLLSYSKLGDKELPRWLNKTSFLSGPSDISPSDFLVSSHFIVKQRVPLPWSSCQNIPVNPLCWYSTHKLLVGRQVRQEAKVHFNDFTKVFHKVSLWPSPRPVKERVREEHK